MGRQKKKIKLGIAKSKAKRVKRLSGEGLTPEQISEKMDCFLPLVYKVLSKHN